MEVSERIRKIRDLAGMSQAVFADALGVPASMISNIERGDREPSKKLIVTLFEKMNVNSNWLLMGVGDIFFSGKAPNLMQTATFSDLNPPPKDLILAESDKSDFLELDLLDNTDIEPISGDLQGRIIPFLANQQPSYNGKMRFVTIPDIADGRSLKALQVDGDSMTPTLADGDVVICDEDGWTGDGLYTIRMSGFASAKRMLLIPGGYKIIHDNTAYPVFDCKLDDADIVGRIRYAVIHV